MCQLFFSPCVHRNVNVIQIYTYPRYDSASLHRVPVYTRLQANRNLHRNQPLVSTIEKYHHKVNKV